MVRQSFRSLMGLVTRNLRFRGWTWGWTWMLSMLWVVIGASGAIYAAVVLTHPGYSEVLLIPPTVQWSGEPGVIYLASEIAEFAWGLLSLLLPVTGFVQLRGWRPHNWLRVAGWAATCLAGLVLMNQAAQWVAGSEGDTRSVLSVGEMAICAAWLVLGILMTLILAVPRDHRSDCHRSDVDTSLAAVSARNAAAI